MDPALGGALIGGLCSLLGSFGVLWLQDTITNNKRKKVAIEVICDICHSVLNSILVCEGGRHANGGLILLPVLQDIENEVGAFEKNRELLINIPDPKHRRAIQQNLSYIRVHAAFIRSIAGEQLGIVQSANQNSHSQSREELQAQINDAWSKIMIARKSLETICGALVSRGSRSSIRNAAETPPPERGT